MHNRCGCNTCALCKLRARVKHLEGGEESPKLSPPPYLWTREYCPWPVEVTHA